MSETVEKSGERIPFNRPFIAGKELYYIAKAVAGGHLAGDGPFARACERFLEASFHARRILLTTSCSSALDMCALLCDIQPEDEIILPSFTFVTSANAFVMQGGRVRFCDIRPDTLNIDENGIEALIGPKSRVIVPVHYAGVGCEMDAIMEIAARHDLLVVEDAAHAVNATYKGRSLGTIGHLGTFSFHETKNYISGEGGALSVNDEHFLRRAEIIRDKGTNRAAFFRGEVDKYTWVDVGSSFLPSEIIAAFLYAQLEEAEVITRKRLEIFETYERAFTPFFERGILRGPFCPVECRHNAHMFYLLTENGDTRDALIAFLRERNIHAVFHYVPLHLSPMGRRMGYKDGDLPVTEDLSARLLRLPCYFELTREDQNRVIEGVFDFFGKK